MCEFEQELKVASSAIIKKVVSRLTAFIETGEPIDSKKLKGRKHLYAFCFRTKGGFRVYFTYLGEREIALVGFGHHDLQRTDLTRLDNLAGEAQKRRIKMKTWQSPH